MNVFQSTRLPPEFNMPRPHRDNLDSDHRKWVNQRCHLPVAQRARKETNKRLLFDIPRSVGCLGRWGNGSSEADCRNGFVACFFIFLFLGQIWRKCWLKSFSCIFPTNHVMEINIYIFEVMASFRKIQINVIKISLFDVKEAWDLGLLNYILYRTYWMCDTLSYKFTDFLWLGSWDKVQHANRRLHKIIIGVVTAFLYSLSHSVQRRVWF